MTKYILPLFFTFITITSFAQDSRLYLKGKVEIETKEPLMNCHLQLFMDDNLVKVDTTGPSGMFKFDSLEVGHVYDLYFEAEGYSLKFVRIDTKEIDKKEMTKFPMVIDMALFSTAGIKPEKLYFLQSEPYAVAKYNKEKDNIEWDLIYLDKMKKKVEEVRKI